MSFDHSPGSQDPKSLIIFNYNKGRPTSQQINEQDFTFDDPVPNTNPAFARNTCLRVWPTATSGKYGAITIYYNRVALNTLPTCPALPLEARNTLEALVLTLNDYYGLGLTANDHSATPPDWSTGNFTLQANPSSLMFIGGLSIGEVIDVA